MKGENKKRVLGVGTWGMGLYKLLIILNLNIGIRYIETVGTSAPPPRLLKANVKSLILTFGAKHFKTTISFHIHHTPMLSKSNTIFYIQCYQLSELLVVIYCICENYCCNTCACRLPELRSLELGPGAVLVPTVRSV